MKLPPGGGPLYAIRFPSWSGDRRLRADSGPWPSINIFCAAGGGSLLSGPPAGEDLLLAILHPPPPRRDMPTSGRGENCRHCMTFVIPPWSRDRRHGAGSGLRLSINIFLPPVEVHSSLARRPGRTSSRLHAIPPPLTLKLPGGEGPLSLKSTVGFSLL